MTDTAIPTENASERDLVTVILPVYNAEPYLDQALSSVEEQTHRALEILCVNDGSTDGSPAIMERHAAADPRIRVIDKRNEGYGASCNRGIAEARGTWIAIVEPDDWIEPAMYADLVAFAHTFDGGVDIAKSAYWRIIDADTPRARRLNCSYRHRIHPPAQPFAVRNALHLLAHHPSIWSAIYRADFLRDRGIRFHEIPGAGWADNPFLIDTLCQTERICYLDRAYYCYREETPEKTEAFATRSTMVPFERWNDMTDSLERIGVTDEGILRTHYRRGFTYLAGVTEYVDLARDDVIEAAVRMATRMDARIVLTDRALSPATKRLFAQLRGLPEPKGGALPYAARLAREGLYTLRNNGMGYTLSMMRSQFGR